MNMFMTLSSLMVHKARNRIISCDEKNNMHPIPEPEFQASFETKYWFYMHQYSLLDDLIEIISKHKLGKNLNSKLRSIPAIESSRSEEFELSKLNATALVLEEAGFHGAAYLATTFLVHHLQDDDNVDEYETSLPFINRAILMYKKVEQLKNSKILAEMEGLVHDFLGKQKGTIVDFLYAYICDAYHGYYIAVKSDFISAQKYMSLCWKTLLESDQYMDISNIITDILLEADKLMTSSGDHYMYPQINYMLRVVNTLIKKHIDKNHLLWKDVITFYYFCLVSYCILLLQSTTFYWKIKDKLHAGKDVCDVELEMIQVKEDIYDFGLDLVDLEYDIPDRPCENIAEVRKIYKSLIRIRKYLKKRNIRNDGSGLNGILDNAISVAKKQFSLD